MYDACVPWPERPKGAKDEVKRPEGPPARSWGPEGPYTSSISYYIKLLIFIFLPTRVFVAFGCWTLLNVAQLRLRNIYRLRS